MMFGPGTDAWNGQGAGTTVFLPKTVKVGHNALWADYAS